MEVETNREPSPGSVEEEQQTVTVTTDINSAEIIQVTTADILQQAATTILSQVNSNLIALPIHNNNNEEQKSKAVKGKR